MTSFEQSDANKARAQIIGDLVVKGNFTMPSELRVNHLIDLMANIRHYCDSQNLDYHNLDLVAGRLYGKQVEEGK